MTGSQVRVLFAAPALFPTGQERPAAVDTSAVEPSKPVAEKKAEKSKRKRQSTEARVIYEPHRHGIYW
jgi:hypothetical protein